MKYTIPWKPHAKQRPRVANGVAYTPTPTKKAEAAIKAAWEEHGAKAPADGPLAVTITMFNDCFTIDIEPTPDHTNRKLRGDIDNYAKTILDSLNTLAWGDDAQITILRLEKA